MNWFAYPLLMKEILDVVSQVQNFDRAISKLLLRNYDIFKHLKKSSLHGWFENGSYTQLKPNYQRAFQLGKTTQGRPKEEMFKNHPEDKNHHTSQTAQRCRCPYYPTSGQVSAR